MVSPEDSVRSVVTTASVPMTLVPHMLLDVMVDAGFSKTDKYVIALVCCSHLRAATIHFAEKTHDGTQIQAILSCPKMNSTQLERGAQANFNLLVNGSSACDALNLQ
eukprot:470893-Amphidinium_carterae.1